MTTKLLLNRFTRLLTLLFLSGSLSTLAAQSAAGNVETGEGLKVTEFEAVTLLKQSQEKKTTFKTPGYEVTLTNRGAEIADFRHLDPDSELKNNVQLTVPSSFPFVAYISSNSQKQFRESLYKSEVKENDQTVEVKMTAQMRALTADGQKLPVDVTKVFRFYKKFHYWVYEHKFVNNSDKTLTLPSMYFLPLIAVGPAPEKDSARAAMTFYSFYHAGDDFETFYSEGGMMGCGGGSEEREIINQNINFFGSSSRFMTVTLQPLEKNVGAVFLPAGVDKEGKSYKSHMQLSLRSLNLKPGATGQHSFMVYTGPKVKELVDPPINENEPHPPIEKGHEDLYKAFDFGMTAPIRDLIVVILQFFHQFIPNYGIGIIIFALLFKLVFFPLNQKQAESMKKMGALSPLMKEINEKYKDNPQEKQRRTMMLYKEHKVNPLGGCLPMVIQIPIFIALYSAFSDAYELWRSPFIYGWIDDLSRPDTVYVLPQSWAILGGFQVNILPLLMAATQFLQTKFTVVSGDSNQKKMMQFMPLLMLFFFWTMPSGVVLYWTVQNLLSVAQQLFTNMRSEEQA